MEELERYKILVQAALQQQQMQAIPSQLGRYFSLDGRSSIPCGLSYTIGSNSFASSFPLTPTDIPQTSSPFSSSTCYYPQSLSTPSILSWSVDNTPDRQLLLLCEEGQ